MPNSQKTRSFKTWDADSGSVLNTFLLRVGIVLVHGSGFRVWDLKLIAFRASVRRVQLRAWGDSQRSCGRSQQIQ